MNKFDVVVWKRDFCLSCVLQKYPGLNFTEKQNKCLNAIPEMDFDRALGAVKEYVLAKNKNEMDENEINNIFKYVMPKQFYVPRSDDCLVALMCDYRFDSEHGIAVVFADGKYKKVCTQDEVL